MSCFDRCIPPKRTRYISKRIKNKINPDIKPIREDDYRFFISPEETKCGYCCSNTVGFIIAPQLAWFWCYSVTISMLIAIDNNCGNTPPSVNVTVAPECAYNEDGDAIGTRSTILKYILTLIQSTMVFMLVLSFQSGLDKYKNSRALFETLTGDVKAMAMLLVHLTHDKEKYDNSNEDVIGPIKASVVQDYKRIKYVLAVLAPVCQFELRGTKFNKTFLCFPDCCSKKVKDANVDLLEDKRYYVLTSKYPDRLTTCERLDFTGLCRRTHVRVKRLMKDSEDEIVRGLYYKIRHTQEVSHMELFECCMTVLLNELSRLSENSYGLGKDEGSQVANAVYKKWEQIYGSWGNLNIIRFMREPNIIHMYRLFMIIAYCAVAPWNYVEEYDMFTRWIMVLVDVSVFILMHLFSYLIRNPFANKWVVETVAGSAQSTQEQVTSLMENQELLDRSDYRGYRGAKYEDSIYPDNWMNIRKKKQKMLEVVNRLKKSNREKKLEL